MTGTLAPSKALRVLLARIGGVAGALVLGQVILGLTYIIAARAITPAVLGTVSTCVAIGTIAALAFDAGLSNLLVREVASQRLTLQEARALVRSKRRLAIALLAPLLVANLTIAPAVGTGVLLGCYGLAVWEAQTANSLLRAQEQFWRAAIGQLSGRMVGLAVVAVGFLFAPHAFAVDYAFPAGLISAFVVEAVIDRAFLGPPRARPRPQREAWVHYREGLGYGLASLAASAQQLDTPLVAAGGGMVSAGLYSAAGRLLNPLGFLATSLGLVGAPALARVNHDPNMLRIEERRLLRVTACAALAPLVAAAAGPFILPLLLGDTYRASGTVFAILAVGSVFSTINQPLAMVVQNRGHQTIVAVAVATGLGIGLAATYVLALLGGATWAAGGFMVSQLYILTHLGLTTRRLRKRAEEKRA
jgi:O-antigen/teichoic acid export membrane protein